MTPEQIEHEREAYTAWLKTPAEFPNLSLALQAWLARAALDRGLPPPVDLPEAVTIDPEIRSGVPCVPGTRVPVAEVLVELADGQSLESIANDTGIGVIACRNAIREVAADWSEPLVEVPEGATDG